MARYMPKKTFESQTRKAQFGPEMDRSMSNSLRKLVVYSFDSPCQMKGDGTTYMSVRDLKYRLLGSY